MLLLTVEPACLITTGIFFTHLTCIPTYLHLDCLLSADCQQRIDFTWLGWVSWTGQWEVSSTQRRCAFLWSLVFFTAMILLGMFASYSALKDQQHRKMSPSERWVVYPGSGFSEIWAAVSPHLLDTSGTFLRHKWVSESVTGKSTAPLKLLSIALSNLRAAKGTLRGGSGNLAS